MNVEGGFPLTSGLLTTGQINSSFSNFRVIAVLENRKITNEGANLEAH